jgi:chemotaxis protein histidine kinase CheA
VDQIKQMMDQLSDITDEQVSELQTSILSEFESVEKEDPTPQTVDAMTSLADMLDGVRNEIKRRETANAELAQKAAEAANRVYGKEDEDKDMKTDEVKDAAMHEEAPADSAEEAPVTEEAPVSETPAPTMEEEKKMEEAAAMPATPEVEDEKSPADMEEDKKEKEKDETMTEASTEADKNSEFSTEIKETTEAAVAVEETVVAAAEEAPATTTAEVPVVAEAAVVEEVAVSQDAPAAEAAVVVTEGAEAATIETPTQTETVPMAQEIMEAPVTAAADNADNLNIEVPADRRPTSRISAAPVAITAGADIPGYTAGSSISSMAEVAEAMAKRLHGLRRVNGGDGEQHIVASISTQFPEERTLNQDAQANWDKVQAVVGPEALVAAGGHQAPFEVKYDIFGIGSAVRPVRDSLPRFQADRGGIRYITPPVLSSYASAVGVWTAANDSAETPSPAAKLSLTVAAASETTVSTDAVTLQLQFGNLLSRAYPELIARHNELGLIQHAREAEGNLLAKIGAASTAVTSTSVIGMGRDFLVQLGRAAAAYRSRHRLDADAPLRAIIPAWVKDAMAADLTIAMPGDSTLNAYAEIDAYIASRGIITTYALDSI